ncbi:MAG: polysaccharide biosynthesis/export family protein [Deltaproteobacteria bacterium]|nr:polysaccharide biosynthesis/export family protein [Deltaproteobacteria bacterium]
MKRLMFLAVLALALGAAGAALGAEYIIGEGDGLRVSVWGVPDLSVEVVVRPDGRITLPAAGDVLAAGRSPAVLSDELGRVLSRYVQRPIVTVTVTQITNNRIYVSGGGVPSRVVPLTGATTLFKFLTQLGSLENADLSRSYIMREGKKVAADFQALFFKGDFSRDLELRAEDILFIPTNENNKIYVVGAVNEPRYIYYREGIKVLDAIFEARGFNQFAKENDVVVLRGDERIRVKLKEVMRGKRSADNILLKPGDHVFVDEGIF